MATVSRKNIPRMQITDAMALLCLSMEARVHRDEMARQSTKEQPEQTCGNTDNQVGQVNGGS